MGDLISHNVLISLNKEHKLIGLYGKTKTFKKIAFSVDENSEFVDQINNQIMSLK